MQYGAGRLWLSDNHSDRYMIDPINFSLQCQFNNTQWLCAMEQRCVYYINLYEQMNTHTKDTLSFVLTNDIGLSKDNQSYV